MASNNKDLDDDDEEELNNELNPFSFKKFINSETSAQHQQRSETSNPLSFKHFINNSNDSVNAHSKQQSFLIPLPPSPPPLPPPPPTPPSLNKTPVSQLPDFVNESLLKNEFIAPDLSTTTSKLSENPYMYLDSMSKASNTKTLIISDEEDEYDRVKFETRNPMSSYFDLETNLNDGHILDNIKHDTSLKKTLPALDTFKLDELTLPEINNRPEISKSSEIESLKKKLKEKQLIINNQTSHIKQLEKTIIDLKQKEVNENKALESIIQQVEQNLVKTTERAVESERSADKLKQEVKQLKLQLVNLSNENQLLRNSQTKRDDSLLVGFSSQINSAASQAETSLKQLLSGVETLRLIAANIESHDKIKDVTNENNTK